MVQTHTLDLSPAAAGGSGASSWQQGLSVTTEQCGNGGSEVARHKLLSGAACERRPLLKVISPVGIGGDAVSETEETQLHIKPHLL